MGNNSERGPDDENKVIPFTGKYREPPKKNNFLIRGLDYSIVKHPYLTALAFCASLTGILQCYVVYDNRNGTSPLYSSTMQALSSALDEESIGIVKMEVALEKERMLQTAYVNRVLSCAEKMIEKIPLKESYNVGDRTFMQDLLDSSKLAKTKDEVSSVLAAKLLTECGKDL